MNHGHTPAYDGNVQNSGIIAKSDKGFIVTKGFVDRYNALIEIYGNGVKGYPMTPPLKQNDGIMFLVEHYIIDSEHMVKFLDMNAWRRNGVSPLKK
jgi:hypothetical protein